jgi:hypothetical protein
MDPVDCSADLENYKSVLIVSCPICPPVSLATERNSPLIQFFSRGIKTPAYEDYLEEIREPLEARGVRIGVFCTYTPCPAMCLWTEGQRGRLLKRARDYEAVLVMGCESARYTVERALDGTDCEVMLAMRMAGITNAAVKFRLPLTVDLKNVARVEAIKDVAGISS